MKNGEYKFIEVPLEDYDALYNASAVLKNTPFVTPEWLKFIADAKNVSIHILKVLDQRGNDLGFLFFGIFKMGPFRLAASPYYGWDSETMGPALNVASPQENLLKEASKYIRSTYRTSLVQFSVVEGSPCFLSNGAIRSESFTSPVVEIDKEEEALLSGFRKDVKKNVRFFAKNGGVFKLLVPDRDTCSLYYDMTLDVYRRRGIKPPYTREFIERMFDADLEAYRKGRCLALGAFDNEGKCIAISVTMIYGEEATGQCFSVYQSGLALHPMEPLFWRRIQELKARGVKRFDLMGEADYKNKFRPEHRKVVRYYFGSKLLLWLQIKAKSFLLERRRKKERKTKAARKKESNAC